MTDPLQFEMKYTGGQHLPEVPARLSLASAASRSAVIRVFVSQRGEERGELI